MAMPQKTGSSCDPVFLLLKTKKPPFNRALSDQNSDKFLTHINIFVIGLKGSSSGLYI
jgi:hypothetical protein